MFRFDHIYRHAALALAQLQEPDFRGFDLDDLCDAFGYAILVGEYQTWLPYFQQLILDASNQQTVLVEQPFSTGIKGLNKTYVLIRGGERKRLILSDGLPVIEFIEGETAVPESRKE